MVVQFESDDLAAAVDQVSFDVMRQSEQMTIFLTTHSMEEAEALCDRIAIIDAGRIIAMGTPAELKGRGGGQRCRNPAAGPAGGAVPDAVYRPALCALGGRRGGRGAGGGPAYGSHR